MKQDYDKRWNDYFIEDTNVLKNNLGITDYEELKEKEAEITFEKLVELYKKPISGTFDKKHLCMIHEYLFGDIYPFAGKYRTVYMQKNNSYFTGEDDIDAHLNIVLKEMHDEFLKCHTFSDYTIFLAEYYYDLLVIHPFREGNGRTVREFIREFVLVNIPEYTLDWSLMDKNNLDEGIKYAFFTKTLIINEFARALIPNEQNNLKKSL